MKKLKLFRLIAVLAMLAGLLAVPSISAKAAHGVTSLVLVNAFAAVCGTSVPSGTITGAAKECTPFEDGLSPLIDQTQLNCEDGKCDMGLVLPGLGDAVGDGTPCGGGDGLLVASTTGCEGGWIFEAGAGAGTCSWMELLPTPGPAVPCSILAEGLLGAGVNGVGAYVGSSGGLGTGTLTVGTAVTDFRIEWEQSAATLLPLHGDVEGHDPAGWVKPAVLGAGGTLQTAGDTIIGLVSARPLTPAEAVGCGTPGLPPPSGTKCFGVVGSILVKA